MKTIELRRRAAGTPAQILNRAIEPSTWAGAGTSVTVHRGAAEGAHLTTRTPLRAADLPAAAARFLGEGAELVQEVRADPVDAQSSQTHVAIAPATSAAIALREVSGGTDIHAITRIVSSVPLFGSMVESALEPYVESLLSERLDQLVDL